MQRERRNGAAAWLAAGLLRLVRHRQGTVAVEFGLVGLAFLGLVLFIVALAFRLYVQVALDYASSRAARLLAVDSKQSLSANPKQFQSVTLCPLLSAFVACSDLTISLQPVTDFRNASPIGGTAPPPFNSGQGGSLMLLRVTYQLPALSWPVPTDGGATGAFTGTVSVGYPFQNEY